MPLPDELEKNPSVSSRIGAAVGQGAQALVKKQAMELAGIVAKRARLVLEEYQPEAVVAWTQSVKAGLEAAPPAILRLLQQSPSLKSLAASDTTAPLAFVAAAIGAAGSVALIRSAYKRHRDGTKVEQPIESELVQMVLSIDSGMVDSNPHIMDTSDVASPAPVAVPKEDGASEQEQTVDGKENQYTHGDFIPDCMTDNEGYVTEGSVSDQQLQEQEESSCAETCVADDGTSKAAPAYRSVANEDDADSNEATLHEAASALTELRREQQVGDQTSSSSKKPRRLVQGSDDEESKTMKDLLPSFTQGEQGNEQPRSEREQTADFKEVEEDQHVRISSTSMTKDFEETDDEVDDSIQYVRVSSALNKKTLPSGPIGSPQDPKRVLLKTPREGKDVPKETSSKPQQPEADNAKTPSTVKNKVASSLSIQKQPQLQHSIKEAPVSASKPRESDAKSSSSSSGSTRKAAGPSRGRQYAQNKPGSIMKMVQIRPGVLRSVSAPPRNGSSKSKATHPVDGGSCRRGNTLGK